MPVNIESGVKSHYIIIINRMKTRQ